MKNKKHRIVSFFVIALLSIALVEPLGVYAEEKQNVKVSDVAYGVQISGAKAYLCNEKAIDAEVGTEMFLTYTVDTEGDATAIQHGVIGTEQPTAAYPYEDGGLLYFNNGNTELLLKKGYTYFMKFVVTENGYEYIVGYAKDDESGYIYLNNEAGTATAKMKHIGLWIDGGNTSIKLTDVHCYDKAGNDLGLIGSGVSVMPQYSEPLPKATHLKHTYAVTVENQMNVRLYNAQKTDSDIIYFEYTVKSSESEIYQSGVILNDKEPTTTYGNGQYVYEIRPMDSPGNGPLLIPGADYLIICKDTHTERGWTALVQCTYKGKTEWFYLSGSGAVHDEHTGFSSLFYGEGGDYPANFVLTNVKCYDEDYNNLGITSNNANILIEHSGELLDYSGCDRVFYSSDRDIFIAIYPDQTVQFTQSGESITGTYYIEDATPKKLTLKLGADTLNYTYYSAHIIDDDKNEYKCLRNYTVTFLSGNGTDSFTQVLSPENGYVVKQPEPPVMDDDTFLYWCTGDGKEFDFKQVITESVTLYAKWQNGGIREYEAVSAVNNQIDFAPYFAVGLSILILLGTAITCIIIARRMKKK